MEKFGVVFAKITQYPKVRTAQLGDVHERDIFPATLFYLTGTKHPATISIDKDRDNQLGMISMLTFTIIEAFDSTGVKYIEDFSANKTRVIIWQQIKNIRG